MQPGTNSAKRDVPGARDFQAQGALGVQVHFSTPFACALDEISTSSRVGHVSFISAFDALGVSTDMSHEAPQLPALDATILPPSEIGKLIQVNPSDIAYIQYDISLEPTYLPQMRALIAKDLSEPYSIYVYRYFLYQWPDLCFFAVDTATEHHDLVAVVICKLEKHRGGPLRGYIAMLATQESHRGKGLAKTLVSKAIDLMIVKDADEIALETEETNVAAMKLYESLGFLRSKKLHRYYLNGNSAYRLLLYLKPGVASIPTDEFYDPYGYSDLPPSAQDDPRYAQGDEDKDNLFSRGII